jgi:hypothetical protein
MKDEDYFIGMMTIGVILTLWLVGGLVCIGRQRTYRVGLWVLGSGAAVGACTALLWDWT